MKQTLHDIKPLFLALVFLLSFNFGWGQTPNGTLDFGNPTDGTVATTANTGFGGVRVGDGGGGFTLKNPGQSIGNLGELRGIAPTGGAINSVGVTSAQNGTSSNVFTIAFDLYLSGGSSGTWYFFAGNGISFDSTQSNGFTGNQVFTGLRWTFGASSSITTVNRSAGSWGSITGTPFSQNTAYKVIIVGNNSNSTVNYGSNSVGAYKYDLWINGVLAGDDLAKALIGNNTDINAFRFYGENSTSNVAELALDNVVWYNSAVNLLVPTPTITTTGTLTSLNTTYGTASSTTSFNVSGANMEAGISINPPTGFEISTTADFSSNVGSNGAPITVGSAGTIASTTIYVRLSATANAGTYSGNIVLSSTNATSKNVATASSTINKVTPTILTTPTATAIFYEQSLSNSSLSGGSASVPGSFSFTNPTFVPTAVGVYPASVTFTPTDTTNYNIVTTTVNVTVNPPVDPTIYINGSSLNFSSLCINTSSVTQTYSVSALSLTNNLIISAPTHFQIKTGAGAWGTSISLTPSSGSISSTTIEVRFAPTAVGVFTSNITHTSTGGDTKNFSVSGEGIDTPPAIGNPSSTSGATTATLGGNITALGCSTTITTRGIEYSTTNGFANGAGTIVSESGTFTTGTFTINVSSLTPNTTYYFKAFATSASGVNYTTESSFTTLKAEPSNHPTNFRATEVATDKIVPVWTRSVAGTQMPDGYLIKANNNPLGEIKLIDF